MIEIQDKIRSVDLPYDLRLYGVSEELFDELVDEDTKAELIDGVMIVHSPASLEHDDLGSFIRTLLRGYGKRKKVGVAFGPDSLVRLKTGRRFAPDAFFVPPKLVPRRKQKLFEGTPDLVVEILSPSNRDLDLRDKRAGYQAAGVPEVWFIDPHKQCLLMDRKRGRRYVEEVVSGGAVTSQVIKGFWLNVDWLWQDPLPDEMDCLEAILAQAP